LQEFCELYYNKKMDNFELYRDEIERVIEEYIVKPFPEIVKWKDKIKIREYIRELILEKIVKADIPTVFKKINPGLLTSLTEVLLKDVGSILDITSLSNDLSVSKLTLMRHLKYLEFGNIIRFVKNYRPSIRAESRKLRKVYPYHISLSLSLFPNIDRSKVLESLVQSSLDLNKYWRRGNKEIDFLIVDEEVIPIEVKNKEEIKKEDLRNIKYFLRKFNLKKAYIIYLGEEREINIEDKEIKLVPISKLLFNFSL